MLCPRTSTTQCSPGCARSSPRATHSHSLKKMCSRSSAKMSSRRCQDDGRVVSSFIGTPGPMVRSFCDPIRIVSRPLESDHRAMLWWRRPMRILILIGLAAFLPALTGARPLALDDYYRWQTVSDPRISQDGRMVAYALGTPDRDTDADISSIWMVGRDG